MSTHAPAWGATPGKGEWAYENDNFYSRPRVGGDLAAVAATQTIINFYSRPRVGGDRKQSNF